MDLLISWFFFGSLVGAAASFIEITPSRQHFMISLLLGIIGAVIGGVVGYQISQYFISGNFPPILYMFLTSVFFVLVPKSYEAPTSLRSRHLLPSRRPQSLWRPATEAENSSHSSSTLRSRFSAKEDKKVY